jgi:hypothetical protein
MKRICYKNQLPYMFLFLLWAGAIGAGCIPQSSHRHTKETGQIDPTTLCQHKHAFNESNAADGMSAINEETCDFESGWQKKRKSCSGGDVSGFFAGTHETEATARSLCRQLLLTIENSIPSRINFPTPLRI